MKHDVALLGHNGSVQNSHRCPRCAGWMEQESFEDLRDDTGLIHFSGWRCLTCGEIIDPLILQNRKGNPVPIQSKTRKRLIFR